MKNFQKEIIIQVLPEKVFAYMDNINNTGMHMTKSSKLMMGSKLELKQLSENATGLNAKFHWLIWATGYNVVAIPLAAGVHYKWGILLTPAVSAVFMSVSTIVVAINAKMLRVKTVSKKN